MAENPRAPELAKLAAGLELPAAIVDLDALDANVDALRAIVERHGKRLRVASKSVRHVGLLRRVMARGGPAFQGVMCFAVDEAIALAGEGFDDLFVAYPTTQRRALRRAAAASADGTTLRLVVDCAAHVEAAAAAAQAEGAELELAIELDVALRPAGVHIGVRRSPVRSVEAALALAGLIRDTPGVRLVGLMGYEAHVAGLGDDNPFAPAMNPVKRLIKRVAQPAVARLRADTVDALRGAGHVLEFVNGGGTGSAHLTSIEACVTEVTAGSGFVCSHLFDYFRALDLVPAAGFALEVCRASDPGMVTCQGGGYVASGEAGEDRLPRPWWPTQVSFVGAEGAGEVQTPLVLGQGCPPLDVGDAVLFRHAKAGELAERFNAYHLVRGGELVATEPTYRGQGWCFF